MLNEKRIKILILVSLFLLESFVWAVNGPNSFWSLGIGDDGAGTSIGKNQNNEGNQAGEGLPAQNPGGQTGEGDQQGTGDSGENDGQTEPGGNGSQEPGSSQAPENNENEAQSLEDAEEKGLLILVNKQHSIDQDYQPDDLREIKYVASGRDPSTRYMREEAADAFEKMVDKAAEDGFELKMTTAYRSYGFQKLLFDSYVKKEGEEAANKYSAKPGQSEHQTGLAVDVSSPSVDYQLSDDYGETKEGKWLARHAHEFGFIIRFPKGKEDITGYQYEPWHIRYVGLTAAEEIYEQKLTLEEYLQEKGLE